MTANNITIGIDLGDRKHTACVLSAAGDIVAEQVIVNDRACLTAFAQRYPGATIVMETGTHSPWVSRLLADLGHEVIVANARKVRLISDNEGKDDPVDAELLARLGRVDVKLLSPIQHRGAEAQAEMAVIRARDALVGARVQLVNHVRGAVKSLGSRLEKSSTRSFADKVGEQVPEALRAAHAEVPAGRWQRGRAFRFLPLQRSARVAGRRLS